MSDATTHGLPDGVRADFERITGPEGIIVEPDRLESHLTEWRGLFRGQAGLMVMPASTDEAAGILRICQARRLGVVPQGGNTGLVGGAIPYSTEAGPQILLSTRRLRAIREVDAENYAITAEAGCLLAEVQQAAEAADRLFPLSLAAEGSCQLGGNISTNAGGINVLRYGTTRDLVLGLEVVLPDGRILEGLRGLRKDNTGYDLKQLFIGAEGTLGLVTAATCKLYPRPRSAATALNAVADPAAAVTLYNRARGELGDQLIAYELMNKLAMDLVLRHIPGSRSPFGKDYDWYVLMELTGPGEDSEAEIEAFLGRHLESGLLLDSIVAQSETQRDDLWRMRHSVSEAQKKDGAGIKHDISVPVARVPEFLAQAEALVSGLLPGVRVIAFGHLGDGNLHFNLNHPLDQISGAAQAGFLDRWAEISLAVHTLAVDLGGSFSAEHGIGTLKIDDLERFRGGVELDIMKVVKKALDPAGIMNPGKLFR